MACSNPSGEDWQFHKSLTESIKYLYEHQIACDVHFRVGPQDNLEDISAHKTILLARSPVFFAMFCGSMAEQTDIISIPDLDIESFKLMLEYVNIYFEEINL